MNLKPFLALVPLAFVTLGLSADRPTPGKPSGSPPATRRLIVTNQVKAVTITRTNYHGWTNCYILGNGKAEVVIVPAIGRVMQFGFVGEEGVFWENRALDGHSSSWEAKDWVNFGGDKTWPAPEADWTNFTKHAGWRPPPAFDALPVEVITNAGNLVLVSAVDPYYGIRTHRRVHLEPNKPVMTISTTYERISGEPAPIGIWVITQLKEPLGIFVPVASKTSFTNGYALLGKTPPPDLAVQGGLLSLTRNPKAAHKIGLESGVLLWVGEKHMLRIDSSRVAKSDYPDGGCSTEIYTNPDPLPYIELETLGPLHPLRSGTRIERSNTYTLLRRTQRTPEADARKALNR